MKALKLGFAILAAALLLGSSCFAQVQTPFLGAGSSAAFNAMSLAGTATPAVGVATTTISTITVASNVGTVTCSGDCDVVAGQSYTISGNSSPSSCTDGTFPVSSVVSATSFKYSVTCANGTYHGGTIAGGLSTLESQTGGPLCTNLPNGSTLATSTNVWVWSQNGKSGHRYLSGEDTRGTIDPANAKGWVEWSGSQDGTTLYSVCVYLAVDSIAGNRLFFATNAAGTPAGVIDFSAGCPAGGIAPDGQLSGTGLFPAESTLPQTVCNALNGLPWNAAPTDVRTEDAEMEATRVCAAYTTTGTGLGYGCNGTGAGAIGSEIVSAFSSGQTQAVAFSINAKDPITQVQIAHSLTGTDKLGYAEFDVAGQTLLVVANTADANGLGSSSCTNVDRRVLERVFDGRETHVGDVCPGVTDAANGLSVLVREPFSGTYTTMEFQMPRNYESYTTQEGFGLTGGTFVTNNLADPSVATFAPLWTGTSNPLAAQLTSSGGGKFRVNGTGEMVNVVAENGGDSNCTTGACATVAPAASFTIANNALLGYTFFSYGNVKPAVGDAKYLTVDGVDPIGTGGVLPTWPATPTNFTNINNGSYPLWNILRVTTSGQDGYVIPSGSFKGDCGPSAGVCLMVQSVQTEIGVIPDLTPLSAMTVFRSHYTATLPGHNGYKTNTPEEGGDVAGAVLTIQSEKDSLADFNAEQLTLKP